MIHSTTQTGGKGQSRQPQKGTKMELAIGQGIKVGSKEWEALKMAWGDEAWGEEMSAEAEEASELEDYIG